jgi:hypothetical protein
MHKIEVTVSSVPDRNNLVSEIWFENNQVAEFSNEESELVVQLYPNPSGGVWSLSAIEFSCAVQKAMKAIYV